MKELKIPDVGEAITEVQVGEWLVAVGDRVEVDQSVVEVETDKASVEIPSPVAGILKEILVEGGEGAEVGDVIGYIEETAQGEEGAEVEEATGVEEATEDEEAAEGVEAPEGEEAGSVEEETEAGVDEAAEEPVEEEEERPREREEERRVAEEEEPAEKEPKEKGEAEERPARERREEEVPMSLLRRRIAERLVEAQQQAALLTTFNEIDMTGVQRLRKDLGERFRERYGTKLGLMSFFVKAAVDALKRYPELNAVLRDDKIVYRHYYDIGIAVGGGKGLVVPVLRDAQRMSFAEIEETIADFAERARSNDLEPDELQGGTFTISNGGVYGSMLSTPIVNPPQSGILGLHAIQDRPVARDGEVVVRPVMYVALTYDHRIVDGREAVSFLKRIVETVEDPARMLLEA